MLRISAFALSLVVLAACSGGMRSALPPASAPAGATGGRVAADTTRIKPSTGAITFAGTGASFAQQVTVVWSDATIKNAGSSDLAVATVSPAHQRPVFANGTYSATFTITPQGRGVATITFSDDNGAEYQPLFVSVEPSGTLFVAQIDRVSAFDAAANGAATPRYTIAGPAGVAIAGIAAAGSTLAAVTNHGVNPRVSQCTVYTLGVSATSWTLGGNANCFGAGSRIGLDASGMPVVLTQYNATPFWLTGGAYGSGRQAAAGGEFVVTGLNHVYQIVDDTHVAKFMSIPAFGTSPSRTISFPAARLYHIAEAPDQTLYVARGTADQTGLISEYVDVVKPNATSARAYDSIGPFDGNIVTALATGADGELYVALVDSTTTNSRILVFAPNTSGMPAPLREIDLGTHPVQSMAFDAALTAPSTPPTR